MKHKRLKKSQHKIIVGVCGGIADYFGFDHTWTRLVFALFTILTLSVGAFIYLILWVLIPDK